MLAIKNKVLATSLPHACIMLAYNLHKLNWNIERVASIGRHFGKHNF